jgi:hypothetical protein
MNEYAAIEYRTLRETIRTRGGTRPLAFLGGLASWAVVLVAVLVWLPNPLASVVPLLLLLASYETVRSLHLGVERIGRYVQVFYEETGGSAPTATPAWEHTAMIVGPSLPGAGVHPYFQPVFLMAALLNFLGVVFPGPVMIELGALAVPHVAFIAWAIYCDRGMRLQRASDLARFRAIRDSLRS